MSEQQLAAVKQALEVLETYWGKAEHRRTKEDDRKAQEAIAALHSIISQDALDKMAEDARTIGLRLDDWDKIGCVNHDCDQCKAVQEPFGWYYMEHGEIRDVEWTRQKPTYEGNWKPLYTTPPAPQPVPVKTYHEGKPWPVQPKPWMGLTTEEIYACDETSGLPQHEITNADLQAFAYAIEAKLKEKNT
jgi:hypothetical protein